MHKGLHQHRVIENDRLDKPCHALLARSLPNGPFPAIGESLALIVLCNCATVSNSSCLSAFVVSNTVYRITDADTGQSFLICLDDKFNAETAKAMALGKEDLFVCRDAALTDEQAANLALQCKLKTI